MEDNCVRGYVLRTLEEYPNIVRRIAILRYEIEHPIVVSPDEVIDSMNFSRSYSHSRNSGNISNKTLYIALNYGQKVTELSSESERDLVMRLTELEQKKSRIDYYVSLLNDRKAQIVRQSFFEDMTWDEIAQEIGVTPRTAQLLRHQAIDELVKMYEFSNKIF